LSKVKALQTDRCQETYYHAAFAGGKDSMKILNIWTKLTAGNEAM